jgi:DivIVA domain-containing protein
MNDEHDTWRPTARPPVSGLTPEVVRNRQFGRAHRGRRGLDETDVYDFLNQIADELRCRDEREAATRAEPDRHKRALQDWSRDHAVVRNAVPTPPAPSVDQVNLMSRTQQTCDQQIRHTQNYCYQIAQEAERYTDSLLTQAQQQAARAAEQAARRYRAAAGDQYSPEREDFQRRLASMRTFIETLSVAERQLAAIREAIRDDIDHLDTGLNRDHQHA